MTEGEAKACVILRLGDDADRKLAQLHRFHDLLIDEAQHQNLIAPSTVGQIWSRHIADSIQLLDHCDAMAPHHIWVDLGSGAGFPGLVIAIARPCRVIMVESRPNRVGYLNRICGALALENVEIRGQSVEKIDDIHGVDVISARAFAPLDRIFALAHRFSTEKTQWVLPKGRSAEKQLAMVRGAWQGEFHVKQSVTDADSAIIVAEGVMPKPRSAGSAHDQNRSRKPKGRRR